MAPTLNPQILNILTQMSEQVIPSGSEDYPGTRETNLPAIIVDRLGNIPGGLKVLTIIVRMWEYSPFVTSLAFKRFSKMSHEQQTQYMKTWECSRLYLKRMAFLGIKALFMVFFYNDPVIWEKIGYKEECLATDKGEALHENN